MGRYLAAGIAIKISVYKRNDLRDFDMSKMEEYKEKLKNQIGQYLDLSHFNIIDNENGLVFNIDIDYFNNNIHDEYIKFKNILNFSNDSYKLDEDYNFDKSNTFNKNEYTIELLCDKEMNYSIYINGNDNIIDTQPFTSNAWLFYDIDNKFYNYDLFKLFRIYIDYVCIYRDIEKIDIENDRNILTALNLLCNKVFENGLVRDISFYISG